MIGNGRAGADGQVKEGEMGRASNTRGRFEIPMHTNASRKQLKEAITEVWV
jgi:hypothetical protein